MTFQRLHVQPPFQGFVDNVPIPHGPANAFDEVVNFLCRKGRFHTRPRLDAFGTPLDGAVVRKFVSFQDELNNLHLLALTTENAYMITSGPTWNLLTYPSGVSGLGDPGGTALPYGHVNTLKRVYFSNGSRPILYADGEDSLKVAGDVQGSARYLTTNAFHLIAAYTTEPAPPDDDSVDFPNRVRWSASGDPNDWTSFGSGANALIEVPDQITGSATLGRVTYIWRTNGLTTMNPTGTLLNPWTFDNFALADSGIGCRFPYAIAVYNDQAVFPGASDIYVVGPGSFKAIGGRSKKRIFSDLDQVAGDVVQGFVISQLGPGLDYLSYWLTIPGVTTWVYGFDEEVWQEFKSGSQWISGMANVEVV